MNLEQITLNGAAANPASGAHPLMLAAGGELVARVVSAPPAGGRGLITLAGGVLRVVRADARELVVRIQPQAASGKDDQHVALRGAGGEAAFTLHHPNVGAVEVRLRLDAAGVEAAVVTPAGGVAERAAATLPDLVAGLERATGRPGIASVRTRRTGERAPIPPKGASDGYT